MCVLGGGGGRERGSDRVSERQRQQARERERGARLGSCSLPGDNGSRMLLPGAPTQLLSLSLSLTHTHTHRCSDTRCRWSSTCSRACRHGIPEAPARVPLSLQHADSRLLLLLPLTHSPTHATPSTFSPQAFFSRILPCLMLSRLESSSIHTVSPGRSSCFSSAFLLPPFPSTYLPPPFPFTSDILLDLSLPFIPPSLPQFRHPRPPIPALPPMPPKTNSTLLFLPGLRSL